MILPRFGMRKKTRSVVSGLLIAVASLVALAYAYEEARANMLHFFVGTLVMILLVMAFAAVVVVAVTLIRRSGNFLQERVRRNASDNDDEPPLT